MMKKAMLAASMIAAGEEARAQAQPKPRASEAQRTVAPGIAGFTDTILFGEVWERPGLAPRDRSLVVISSLIAGGSAAQLTSHLRIGLENGLKPGEISEIITHQAFYSGWPNAVSAVNVAHEVFKAQGINTAAFQPGGVPLATPASDASRAAKVRAEVAPVAPALADYTNRVLFADLWRRPGLTARDRSLATIAALVTTGDTAQLDFHLRLGMDNGLTREQIAEAVNHLAFYAGWPKAMAAVPVLKTVFDTATRTGAAEPLEHVRAGTAPVTAPARNFTGSVKVDTAFQASAPARLGGARVTFQPGARTNWHRHALGQTLIVVAGRGLVQEEGGAVREVAPGDVILTAPGVKHWHGATADSAMTHFAVAERGEGENVTWLEPVSEKQFRDAR